MTPEERSLVLAALLHDVGKLGQRANSRLPNGLSPQIRRLEDMALPSHQGRRSHYHALYTAELLRIFEREPGPGVRLPGEWFRGLGGMDLFPPLALYHHHPQTDLGRTLSEADQHQAEEREGGLAGRTVEGEEEERRTPRFRETPLRSVLEMVWSPSSSDRARPLSYRPAPLSLDFGSGFPEAEVTPSTQDWESLWTGLQGRLERLLDLCARLPALPFEVFAHWLQGLLEAYTWCVPADAQNAPELPLYDHLRITSALALAHRRTPGRCTLVLGDLGGIQHFIYRLDSPGRGRGVARVLRGRSFFLAVLNEFLARWLARHLDLAPSSVIWATGGNFLLLAPGGQGQAINDAFHRIEGALFNAFKGEIGLALAHREFGLEEVCGPRCGESLQTLYDLLQWEKARRWAPLLDKTYTLAEEGEHCALCGTFPAETDVEEGYRVCGPCDRFQRWGRMVPRLKGVAFTEPGVSLPLERGVWRLEPLGAIHLFTEVDTQVLERCFASGPDAPWFFTGVGEPGVPWGFRTLARTVPFYETEGSAHEAASLLRRRGLLAEGEALQPGETVSNTALAEASTGDALLAVARADVDFLGLVMSAGLPKERRTLSRVAALSRSLEWFFSGRVDFLASQHRTPPLLQTPPLRGTFSAPIYIGYSGGDDLFALGPWDALLDFLMGVEEEFQRWTGGCLSLSAGVILVKGQFPIGRGSRLAGDAEEEAKKSLRKDLAEGGPGGGRLAFGGAVLTWGDARRAWGVAQNLARLVHGEELDRRFLFKAMDLLGPDQGALSVLFWPRLYYLVARTVKEEHRSHILSRFQELANGGSGAPDYGPQTRARLQTALLTARLLTQTRR